jgi:hypothetical protein
VRVGGAGSGAARTPEYSGGRFASGGNLVGGALAARGVHAAPVTIASSRSKKQARRSVGMRSIEIWNLAYVLGSS